MPRLKFDVVDEYVRTASGDLEILSRTEIANLDALLRTLGTRYRAPLVATRYAETTTDECARAAASNLERLTNEASYIKGLTAEKASTIDGNLRKLSSIVLDFQLRQDAGKWEGRLLVALEAFKKSPLMEPQFAGSAVR